MKLDSSPKVISKKKTSGGILETVKTVVYAVLIALVVRTIAYETIGDFGIGLEMPHKIAMSENAEQLSLFIGDDRGARAHVRHRFQDRANGRVGRDDSKRVPRPHDLMNPQEQAAPNHPGRMESSEILLGKAACLEQDHR